MKNQRELDYANLEYREYITKYYSNYDLSRWNKYWKDNILIRMFDEQEHDKLRQEWGIEGKGKYFNFENMELFYSKIKNDIRFEDDIKRFFAFLSLDGYFESKKITYEEFLNAPNLNHPHEKAKDERELSLNELSKIEGGQNYIRVQLPSIGWLKM